MLKRFNPGLFLGEPDFVVDPIERDPPADILVHVAGAVQSPGVYHLPAGARVEKAIEIAGGPTEKADIHKLNLAAKISDGQRINVPELRQPSPLPDQGSRIDVNDATFEQLKTLPGIGPEMARRIVEFRETNGSFSSVDDLGKVRGIGDKKLDKIRHLVDVR